MSATNDLTSQAVRRVSLVLDVCKLGDELCKLAGVCIREFNPHDVGDANAGWSILCQLGIAEPAEPRESLLHRTRRLAGRRAAVARSTSRQNHGASAHGFPSARDNGPGSRK